MKKSGGGKRIKFWGGGSKTVFGEGFNGVFFPPLSFPLSLEKWVSVKRKIAEKLRSFSKMGFGRNFPEFVCFSKLFFPVFCGRPPPPIFFVFPVSRWRPETSSLAGGHSRNNCPMSLA